MNIIQWQYQKELLFYPMPLYRDHKTKFHVDCSQVSLFFNILQSLGAQLQTKKCQHNQYQYPASDGSQ